MEHLKTQLFKTFFKTNDKSFIDYSAMNLVLLTLLKSPYFEKGYDNYFISKVDYETYSLYQFDNDRTLPIRLNVFNETKAKIQEKIRNKKDLPYPNVDKIPSVITRKYEKLLSEFIQDNRELIKKLFSPSKQDFEKKYTIKYKLCDDHIKLDKFLGKLLGHDYDRTLKNYGIDFHSPDFIYSKSRKHIVAYNDEEIAGLLSYLPRKYDNGLSFVSVSKGFRNHHISKNLYQNFIEICQKEQKILKRSSPSDFSLQHPEITNAYDKILLNTDVLHVSSRNHRFYKTLLDMMEENNYKNLLSNGKSLCDEMLKTTKEGDYFISNKEETIIKSLKTNIKTNKQKINY